MALFYKVDGARDLAHAFAAHDLYSSLVNGLFGRVLTPADDDFYTAPWSFMPEFAGAGGYLVLTCMVPWLHGHGHLPGRGRKAEDCRAQHFRGALEAFSKCDPSILPPYVDLPEKVQDELELDEDDIVTFTDDGCYPGREDVSTALEDRAVVLTCNAMGWEVPPDWRRDRERRKADLCVDKEGVFDLAAHEERKPPDDVIGNKRRKCSTDEVVPLISRRDADRDEWHEAWSDRDDDRGRGRGSGSGSVRYYEDETTHVLDENGDDRRHPHLGYDHVDEEEEQLEPPHNGALDDPQRKDVQSVHI